jgi:hypothetical protein
MIHPVRRGDREREYAMRNSPRNLWIAGFGAGMLCWLGACAPVSQTYTPMATTTRWYGESPSAGAAAENRYTPTNDGRIYTKIPTEESGPIAVQVTLPTRPRFPEGAGVLVEVPPFFTPVEGYQQSLETHSIGIVHVTFLWPGCRDPKTGDTSGGNRDYGGAGSIAALRDVIRFASGELADTGGKKISDIAGMPVLEGNLGLYAFSHPGLAAVAVMAGYGNGLPGLRYYVGRENPTVDAISAMEIGHFGSDGQPVPNPGYEYPDSFRSDRILLDYSSVRWDPDLPACAGGSRGAPYFDRNGNGRLDSGDHALGTQCPSMFGMRVYSAALTAALERNNVFAPGEWPEDLATVDFAMDWWSIRESPGAYPALTEQIPGLKVMLVFGERDHVQVARDKPHIHQAWLGFRESAGLWVRLNPDFAYAECMGAETGDWQDHPAGAAPQDWLDAYLWGHPDSKAAAVLFPLAGVAEMADRTYSDNWAPDLDGVLAGTCKKA